MEIIVNGDSREVSPNTTIAELLEEMDIKSKMIAVEVNCKIIPKKEHRQWQLQEGDKLEIVHPVGGG